jgi:glycosyltransferase involved in cell wall biosynthesis
MTRNLGTKKPSRRTILYFGNDWFAENRTSSHHVASFLSKHFDVHYIECPGLRAPASSGRDVKKMFMKLWNAVRGARTVRANLHVNTLLQIPFHRFRWVRQLNGFLVDQYLRFLMRRQGIRKPVLWFMVPHVSQVLGRLREDLAVYYCIDDYAALPGVNEQAIATMDSELTRKANLVFVASGVLLEQKRQVNSSSYPSPHGVDYDHFSQAQNPGLAVPGDLKDIPRPIVGFTGLIESWIDLDLVAYLAGSRPAVSFVLIGRVAVSHHEAMDLPNVHFLGKRPYDILPAYGKAFDAAIIPYRLNKQVLHANPIKLREYLAMGKSIVSVSTPEIDKYDDVVLIAQGYEEFLAKLDQALARADSTHEVQRRMNRVREETWERKLEDVLGIVQERLDGARLAQDQATRTYPVPSDGATRLQRSSAG